MSERISLMALDVLPGHSAVAADVDVEGQRVRFQAMRRVRLRRTQVSQYSGWFPLADCPIHLTWAAFDWSRRDGGD